MTKYKLRPPEPANPLPQACRDALRLSTVRLVAVRENSRIYRCDSETGEVAVKVCLDRILGGVDIPGARLEYESLHRLLAATNAAGERRLAPQPLALFEEQGIVAMTWEYGFAMTEMLLSPSTSRQQGRSFGMAAGDWLHSFQRLRPIGVRVSDFAGKLQDIEAGIRREGLAGDRLFAHALDLLHGKRAAAESVPLPVSWIHGDFKSDNVMLGQNMRALSLDVQFQHENTVIHNIAPFLVHLDLLRWSPRGLLNWWVLTHAAEGFLAACSPPDGAWQAPISWLQTEMLLQRGLSHAGPKSLGGRLRQAAVNRALTMALRKLAMVQGP